MMRHYSDKWNGHRNPASGQTAPFCSPKYQDILQNSCYQTQRSSIQLLWMTCEPTPLQNHLQTSLLAGCKATKTPLQSISSDTYRTIRSVEGKTLLSDQMTAPVSTGQISCCLANRNFGRRCLLERRGFFLAPLLHTPEALKRRVIVEAEVWTPICSQASEGCFSSWKISSLSCRDVLTSCLSCRGVLDLFRPEPANVLCWPDSRNLLTMCFCDRYAIFIAILNVGIGILMIE